MMIFKASRKVVIKTLVTVLPVFGASAAHSAATQLADQPVQATIAAPANVVFTPSVEFPTAISVAHLDASFNSSKRYQGYFDPLKCYTYVSSDPNLSGKGYFNPTSFAAADYGCAGSGEWSGNFMNWATMQAIDLFRLALTGGARDVDIPSAFSGGGARTVLRRAVGSNQGSAAGNFPDRPVNGAAMSQYVASPWSIRNFTITNWARGDQVRLESSAGSVNLDVRVEVCVSGMLEPNCKAYPDPGSSTVIYRPEGLIQENLAQMRFAAFGYVIDQYTARDGGVLRAPMGDVSNEITETGAFKNNPSPSTDPDAVNSGVINYINLFGFAAYQLDASNAYKKYDPVGELYAEALRYLKGYDKPTEGYAVRRPANLSDANWKKQKDGFPVYSDWSGLDPIVYSCQKNFIIGIGDVNTHADRNLYGRSGAMSLEPSLPSNIDTQWGGGSPYSWTDTVGGLEGLGALGSATADPNSHGFHMAGMAYYAHTNDIRPQNSFNSIEGKQTVQTYWIDVLEGRVFKWPNQFWLAAKYGGFTNVDENSPEFNNGVDIWNEGKSIVDKNGVVPGHLKPNNYFPASNAEEMVSGLRDAFAQINKLIAAGAGVGLSSSSISTSIGDSSVFGVSYDSKTWSGSVKGYRITNIDAVTGALALDEKWDLASKLDGQDWNSGRLIATSKRVGNLWSPIPFRWGQLTSAQQTQLADDAPTSLPSATPAGQHVLQFIRGRRDQESTDTQVKSFRQRAHVLGDVVNSEAVYVGKPSAGYSDAFNPGYSSFVTANNSRSVVTYVGANDGMLHAVDADTSGVSGSTGGSELWAYIPSFFFEGENGDPSDTGLASLTKRSFVHRYFVDQTPVVRDVDFKRAARAGVTLETDANVFDWRTILVGGLGKGGRGYYAIDVTDPSVMTSETAVAGKVLWEFSDEDMGYSYGRPVIVKTRKWGWVVILTSGYNNVGGTDVSKRGKGVLYVVNPETGELLQKVYTTAGAASDPSGFAQVTGYTQNYQDYTVDYVYGGDLFGNVWRFDLTSASALIPSPLLFATVKDSTGGALPITTAPQVEYSAADPQLRRWVFVGTGRQLHAADSPDFQAQSFYAFQDGTRSAPYVSANLPTGMSFPITRSVMTEATYNDLANTGVTVGGSTPMGWYVDLTGKDAGTATNPATERVVINPVANDGVISWVGSIPSTDPCTPGGTSRLYAVKYASAKSVVYTTNNLGVRTYVSYLDPKSPLVKAQPVRQGNSIRFLGTKVDGTPVLIGPGLGAASTPRVVNWRFIE